jgi:hypothetical protein
MSQGVIIAGVAMVAICCSVSSTAYVMMGGDEEKTTTITGPTGPAPPSDPCAGLTDSSPASAVPVSCLRKILKDEGCTDKGTVWPGDDYAGWWRQDDGAGNFGVVKGDIHAWATSTEPMRVDGCGGATPCKGLTDSSPASAVPVSCLRKILTDEGCTDKGTIWPQDGYDGWWRQDNGAGNFGVVKSDINFWATSTDPTRVAGCGRST